MVWSTSGQDIGCDSWNDLLDTYTITIMGMARRAKIEEEKGGGDGIVAAIRPAVEGIVKGLLLGLILGYAVVLIRSYSC